MMSSLLLLPALALLLGATEAPPEVVGLGIASVSVETGVRLDLFAEPDATDPVLTVELVEDPSILSIVLASEAPEWFRPETLWLDYSLFTFRVVSATDAALEVVVDAEGGRTLWLRRQPAVEFKPWVQFLVEDVTGFSRVDPASNPLRVSPDPSASIIPYSGSEYHGWECLAVAEVRGEWARVRLSDLCAFGDTEPVDGWVRWRDQNELLIGYGMTC